VKAQWRRDLRLVLLPPRLQPGGRALPGRAHHLRLRDLLVRRRSLPSGQARPSGHRPAAQRPGRRALPAMSAPARPGTRQARPRYRQVASGLAMSPTVSIVIPAINEATNLPAVFATLPGWVDEVILVDGRSTDDTVAVARRLWPGLKVLTQPGTGKGDALVTGFAAARGDIIVTIDGDGSTDGTEIISFVTALVAGADFAKGSRFASAGGSDDITISRWLGNRLLSMLVNAMFGTSYSDLCYGYNAFWARHLPELAIDCQGFEIEAQMIIRAAKAGLRIQEIPSHERPRQHGSSNLSIVRDGGRILRVIVQERLRPPARRPADPPAAEVITRNAGRA
jgi:hypothetical protein